MIERTRRKPVRPTAKRKIILLCGIVLLVIVAVGAWILHTQIVLPLAEYEASEWVAAYDSPDGKRSAHLYYLHCAEDYSYLQSGGAAYQGTEELNPHTMISMYGEGGGKTVYYQYGFVDPAQIRWMSNDVLEVNGVQIHPSFSVYDYRVHFWK